MKNLLRCLLCLSFTVLLFAGLSAQPQWKAKQIAAKKTDSPVRIDGLLDEDAWGGASIASDFIQLEPEKGSPASEKTLVSVLFDGQSIYFGFWCYDSEPKKIAGRVTKRDMDLRTDDSVYVLIDTFHDRRS